MTGERNRKNALEAGTLRQSPEPGSRSKQSRFRNLLRYIASGGDQAAETSSRSQDDANLEDSSRALTTRTRQPLQSARTIQSTGTMQYGNWNNYVPGPTPLSTPAAMQQGQQYWFTSEPRPQSSYDGMPTRSSQPRGYPTWPSESPSTMLRVSAGDLTAPSSSVPGGFSLQDSMMPHRSISLRGTTRDGRGRKPSSLEILNRLNDLAASLLDTYDERLPSGEKALEFLLQIIPGLLGDRDEENRKLSGEKQQMDAEIVALRQEAKGWYEKFRLTEETAKKDLDSLKHSKEKELAAITRAMETSFADKEAQARRQHDQELRSLRRDYDAKVRSLQTDHAREVSGIQANHEISMAQLKQACEDQVAELHRVYTEKLEKTTLHHKRDIAQMNNDWESRLRDEINSTKTITAQKDSEIAARRIENERLSNRMAAYSTNRYRAIPDKDFAVMFGSISQRIIDLSSNTTSLFRGGGGSSGVVGAALDPHDFLGRRGGKGRNWVRLVRNACWTVLLRGFFSRPVGFGAFGADARDQETLNDMYALFAGGDRAAALSTDQVANAARAWFFSMILQGVTAGNLAGAGGGNNHWRDLFQRNVDNVATQLSRVLQQLGGDGGTTGNQKAESIAADMGLLALRMGSQRAHVLLETCTFGDSGGRLGEWFKHESEGAPPPPEAVLVDLMLQPCLRRVGDGHEDTRSQKILAQGVFLAQK